MGVQTCALPLCRLRADIPDGRPVDNGFRDPITRIGGRKRADHPAAKIAQDGRYITPGKIGTAAIVDTIAAGELGHVARGQLQRIGPIYVPTVEAAASPDRKSVVEGKRTSVCVYTGGLRNNIQ